MKSTSRRNFLQSVGGAMVALPWLESVANADAGASVAKRMVHYYVPIGVVRRGFFPGTYDLSRLPLDLTCCICPKALVLDILRHYGVEVIV